MADSILDQIEKAQAAGYPIGSLDSHQHCIFCRCQAIIRTHCQKEEHFLNSMSSPGTSNWSVFAPLSNAFFISDSKSPCCTRSDGGSLQLVRRARLSSPENVVVMPLVTSSGPARTRGYARLLQMITICSDNRTRNHNPSPAS